MQSSLSTACKTLLVCTLLLSAACVPIVREHVVDVNPQAWSLNDAATIAVQNDDTTSVRDISLIVRVNRRFTQGSLPIEIETTAPDSTRFAEPFTVKIPQVNKDFREAEVPYRRGVVLSKRGVYNFIVTPSQDNNLIGICAIGVKIIPSKSN